MRLAELGMFGVLGVPVWESHLALALDAQRQVGSRTWRSRRRARSSLPPPPLSMQAWLTPPHSLPLMLGSPRHLLQETFSEPQALPQRRKWGSPGSRPAALLPLWQTCAKTRTPGLVSSCKHNTVRLCTAVLDDRTSSDSVQSPASLVHSAVATRLTTAPLSVCDLLFPRAFRSLLMS